MQADLRRRTSHGLVLISLSVGKGKQLVQIATNHRANCHGKDSQRSTVQQASKREKIPNNAQQADTLPRKKYIDHTRTLKTLSVFCGYTSEISYFKIIIN